MMDAKDMTRKATGACEHSEPIVKPCPDCVERDIRAWEASIRLDAVNQERRNWNEEKKFLNERTSRAEAEKRAAESVFDKLRSTVASLERVNEGLRLELKMAKVRIDELDVQSSAERASEYMRKKSQQRRMPE